MSDATRAALVAAGRSLFATKGFADVATEEIVQTAGLTRGALYHHFKDKAALFAAVLHDVERELAARAEATIAKSDDPWDRLVVAAHSFLDAYLDAGIRRIAVADAASVLSHKGWCDIVEEHTLRVLRERLAECMEAGLIEQQDLGMLGYLLMGSINVGARVIAQADDPVAARGVVGATADRMLEGLRVGGTVPA